LGFEKNSPVRIAEIVPEMVMFY